VVELKGFWSYVHADDDADGGRVSRLAHDVAAQFEMLTGEKIDLFLDRDDIDWGEDWRNKIDESLSSVGFFIAVLTPRYFTSPECRRELQRFARRAQNLGIKELVLPLLYVDVPALHEDLPSDDLVALVKPFQWENWRELRFSDVDSGEYRRGVARLAQRLVEANKKADEANIVAAALELEAATEDEDDSPGLLDKLVATEETLPQWHKTLEAISEEITRIGSIVQEAAEDMERSDKQGKGFAARLTIARRLSQKMREPSEKVWSFGNDFASQLHQVDTGLRAIIERAPNEVNENPEARSDVCEFFDSIEEVSAAAHEGLDALQSMVDAISPVEAMSRDLRRPLKRLRQGLTLMVEAREVTDEWVELIEGAGIDCEDVGSAS
jgi:TIR domain